MARTPLFSQKGFTLIELVTVIIILSALGIATSRYITTGVDLYTDITDRDKSLNSARFMMERLRREVSNALPNSATIEKYNVTDNDGWCLTFTPIVASSIYAGDFPIFPLSKSSGSIATISDYTAEAEDKAVVYLLEQSELNASNTVQAISGINTNNVWTIDGINASQDILTFTGDASFLLASPAKRLYIIRNNISYYFNSNNELRRGSQCADGVLMAENISGSFSVKDATLQRNGLVQAKFLLDPNGERMPVEQTVHINNVP
jgi:MSHA biogenesis protein MshO